MGMGVARLKLSRMKRWIAVGGLLALMLASNAAAQIWKPLSKPGEVLLSQGSIGKHGEYVASISSPPRRSRGAPCLSGDLKFPQDGTEGNLCFSLREGAVFPLTMHVESSEFTLATFVYRPKLARLRLKFSNRPDIMVGLKPLGNTKLEKSRLDPLNYAVRTIGGPFCLTRVIGYGQSGDMLRSTPENVYCPRH